MKKKIGLLVLLIAVTAGMAFAENGREIPVNGGMSLLSAGIKIKKVVETTVGIRIYYEASSNHNKVTFDVDAIYQDGTQKNNRDWESMKIAKSGTIDMVFLHSSRIKQLQIAVEVDDGGSKSNEPKQGWVDRNFKPLN